MDSRYPTRLMTQNFKFKQDKPEEMEPHREGSLKIPTDP